jgi:cytosine/adenosine deaminase-related metal-dependent hydrolase
MLKHGSLFNRIGRRARIFVPAGAPQYAVAVEWSKTAHSAEWRRDDGGRDGIWVTPCALCSCKPQHRCVRVLADGANSSTIAPRQ